MDKHDERFQKRLAIYQIGLTAVITIAALMMTLGFTYSQFALLPTESSSVENSTSHAIQTWIGSVRGLGQNLIYLGAGLIVVFVIFFMLLTAIDKPKSNNNKSSQIIPLDKTDDGKDFELEKANNTIGILDENRKSQTASEKNQLQESLQNTKIQLQIAETKLQISELKNQMTEEKLNKLEFKLKHTSKGKIRDSKRTKKSL